MWSRWSYRRTHFWGVLQNKAWNYQGENVSQTAAVATIEDSVLVVVRWKDGNTSPVPLHAMKESEPLATAEYAVAAKSTHTSDGLYCFPLVVWAHFDFSQKLCAPAVLLRDFYFRESKEFLTRQMGKSAVVSMTLRASRPAPATRQILYILCWRVITATRPYPRTEERRASHPPLSHSTRRNVPPHTHAYISKLSFVSYYSSTYSGT